MASSRRRWPGRVNPTYMCVCLYIDMNIYIGIDIDEDKYLHTYIYIHIYIYKYMYKKKTCWRKGELATTLARSRSRVKG